MREVLAGAELVLSSTLTLVECYLVLIRVVAASGLEEAVGAPATAAGGINRGVAVAGDRVFMVTDHAHTCESPSVAATSTDQAGWTLNRAVSRLPRRCPASQRPRQRQLPGVSP